MSELRHLIQSFTDPEELTHFAMELGIAEDADVQEQLRLLQQPSEFQEFVEEFENTQELSTFAQHMSIPDDPDVIRKLSNLRDAKRPRRNLTKPYVLEQVSQRTFRSNAAIDTKYAVKLDPAAWDNLALRDIHDELYSLFDDALHQVNADPHDLCRVLIEHGSLKDPIVIKLQPMIDLNADVVLEGITKVLQSFQELKITDSFAIHIGVIHVPTGSGRHRITNLDEAITKKKSIVRIENDDTICLSRAIAVSWASCHKVTNTEWRELTEDSECRTMIDKVLETKKVSESFYNNIRDGKRNEQKKLALKLCELADVSTDSPLGLNEVSAFESVLDVNILVVSAKLGNKFIKVSDNPTRKNIYVYYVQHEDQGHYHAITSISGFFSTVYFCETCLKCYSSREGHSCLSYCIICKSSGCIQEEDVKCAHCNMMCRSAACFNRHQNASYYTKGKKKGELKTPSQCNQWWKCPTCYKVVKVAKRSKSKHVCGEFQCKGCGYYVLEDHQCYVRATEPKESKPKFIFYDFETCQDTIMECPEGYTPLGDGSRRCQNCTNTWCGSEEHVPNLVVARSSCDSCEYTTDVRCDNCGSRCPACENDDDDAVVPCSDSCGHREVIFKGKDTAAQFGAWLFTKSHKNYRVIAHNAKAFDIYFLLEYMIGQSMRPQKIIYQGSKIMYMYVGKGLDIKLIDSLNFLPMPLRSMPKAFGIPQITKGWFPHVFNVKDNQNYRGPYPDVEYYGADSMSKDERAEFLTWHATKQGKTFKFAKQILAYCRSDVDVLSHTCLKFRDLMKNVTGEYVQNDEGEMVLMRYVDPFDCVTIASTCMTIYRTKFLEEIWKAKVNGKWIYAREKDGAMTACVDGVWTVVNTEEKKFVKTAIAMVPNQQHDQYSLASIQWLEWLSHKQGIFIQHALNGGEKKIEGTRYKCDGFAGNTIFEFHGDFYHGCLTCHPNDRDTKHPRTGQSLEELYVLTKKKETFLKSKGYQYVCIWEHEFNEELKKNRELKDFVKNLDLTTRLEPRDSFYGGRTNACKLHYKIKEEETIKYVDFTSLYPYVCKYAKYPSGHPEIVSSHFKNIDQYFGMAKVKILPPRGLYHPVLPMRSNGKLKFPLCRTCADTEQQTPCQCNDEQRTLEGTWCTPELVKATQKGYVITRIYEIYHWPSTTQYDRDTKSGGLFSGYINQFLKIKQESSDWPSWINTQEDKDRYVTDYETHEGIKLDAKNICKNPGLRSLAKLCLNSLWGKFGERLNLKQTEILHEEEGDKFFQIIADPSKEIHDFHIIGKDLIQIEYTHKKTFVPESKKANIYIASFTTCWARLRLYEVLEQLNENVLYYDTDSVIYSTGPGQPEAALGDYLGDLTDELCPGEFIVEFVSGGPKNYAYRTNKGVEVVKVRGFTLNFKNSQKINFEAVKELVTLPDVEPVITFNPRKICREKLKRKIYNRPESKRYQVVYTKRVISNGAYNTVPYGY